MQYNIGDIRYFIGGIGRKKLLTILQMAYICKPK